MVKRAHMVGNGPSGVEFKKISPSDFVLGCNIPKVKVDLTTFSDSRLIQKIRDDGIEFNTPLLVQKKLYEVIQKNYTNVGLNIQGVYNRPGDLKPGVLSSGHYAVYWLIEQGYDEIHIWGVDSRFKSHMFSHTDQYVESHTKKNLNRMIKVTKRWNEEWDSIIESNPNINIIFHPPTKDYSSLECLPLNADKKPINKKLVYLFNDTSSYHNGCIKVIESFSGVDRKVETKHSRDVLSNIDYTKVSKVILNGEGTMHHNQWSARRFLMGLRMAQQFGCITEIRNTVWQEMSNEFDDVLKKCDVITVREVLSQQELKTKHGIDAKIVPDRSLLAEVPNREYPHVNIYEGQYIKGHSKSGNYKSPYPRIDIFRQDWNEVVNRLRNADLLITQRHHEMYAAIKAHCRFLVEEGNTWKNRGLAETVGAKLPSTIEEALSGAYDMEYKKIFDYCDNIKNMV